MPLRREYRVPRLLLGSRAVNNGKVDWFWLSHVLYWLRKFTVRYGDRNQQVVEFDLRKKVIPS